MLQKLSAGYHAQPFRGPFSITRIQPSDILKEETDDSAFGPLSNIDHAIMKKGLTIKMHEHVNDEIFSYVWKGTSYHNDSAGFETLISPGKLMMVNARYSFWHEERLCGTPFDHEKRTLSLLFNFTINQQIIGIGI
ncbi:pirin family protein [Oceanobacillus rekensis]|uniref:pirin family protein n=1 Tax=Oceanobacillus rekensis TaxID=937927 RepID=UPI000B44E8CB|nr:pirin family protein [Oceanobacillus rekensis]